jgi:hypothetical protein
MARISHHEGKFDETIEHLRDAIEYKPSPDLNIMIIMTYAEAGDFESARGFIDFARQNHPMNPMQYFVWSKRLDALSLFIDRLDRDSSSARSSH